MLGYLTSPRDDFIGSFSFSEENSRLVNAQGLLVTKICRFQRLSVFLIELKVTLIELRFVINSKAYIGWLMILQVFHLLYSKLIIDRNRKQWEIGFFFYRKAHFAK